MCMQKEQNIEKSQRKKGLLANLLSDNRGASLLFVLGIMMFLLVICTSVLAAAGNNVGYMVNQREYSQIQALDESIHRAIMFSLQANVADDVNAPASLGLQLARALVDAEAIGGLGPVTMENGPDPGAGILLDYSSVEAPTLADPSKLGRSSSLVRIGSIEFLFIDQWVTIVDGVPAICLWVDEDGSGDPPHGGASCEADDFCIAREPGEAWVAATLQVTVVINITTPILGAAANRTVSTRAIYSYTGGHLLENPDDADFNAAVSAGWEWLWQPGDVGPPLTFGRVDSIDSEGNVGRWVLESYETIRN